MTLSWTGSDGEGAGGIMVVLTLRRTDGGAVVLARNITVNLMIMNSTAGMNVHLNHMELTHGYFHEQLAKRFLGK